MLIGITKFNIQIKVATIAITHSLTPNNPNKKIATLPFKAKSIIWKLGNEEANK